MRRILAGSDLAASSYCNDSHRLRNKPATCWGSPHFADTLSTS